MMPPKKSKKFLVMPWYLINVPSDCSDSKALSQDVKCSRTVLRSIGAPDSAVISGTTLFDSWVRFPSPAPCFNSYPQTFRSERFTKLKSKVARDDSFR